MKADEQRQAEVRQAVANERLENLVVSEESQRIADNYIVGKVDAKQVADQIRARYGISVK
ncbi:MAG: antitoxin VbhA family protein [Propionibacteriaceae bacterium]|jgi:hypothetical protein|nr:antitoxin VbhA family protein [Propionibacteriaceae bacterium]